MPAVKTGISNGNDVGGVDGGLMGAATGLLQPGHLALRSAAIDLTRKLWSQGSQVRRILRSAGTD
ncbi:MAG TPA: hypothetical protein DDZ51_29100 [Planctomycetaceae bacterium]|nr:hypothetical protein [Planctomycetaceae bacterium]